MVATLAVNTGFSMPPWIKCGKKLRVRREKLGLTLGDVAVESDIPLSVAARIERGQIHGLDMPMMNFFQIIRDLCVFPLIICSKEWNDSTQYAEIFRLGVKIDINPVRPLHRN